MEEIRMNNDFNNNQQQPYQQQSYQNPPPQGPYQQYPGNPNPPGKGAATGSLVCGIISLAIAVFLGWTVFACIAGLILGIVGAVLAVNSKKQGFTGGSRTAGLVMSIIGTVLNGIVFGVCLACSVCVGVAGGLGSLGY